MMLPLREELKCAHFLFYLVLYRTLDITMYLINLCIFPCLGTPINLKVQSRFCSKNPKKMYLVETKILIGR